ncbi:type IV toxin-antitoxin system AbiEi family antitoxin [Croceivirga sp. JEA036]|uniref:type IV toxin-antitoxin system AbiEi family antitoxin n=1 Tax=Croceivirga sp. JEA036 TaxID=2721162 RepID=UPI001438CD56|nr:type IV toxin-antitoxin system AbiEi family antitoxin [Croceivirga sp. JEA036]NJB37793.1 hypothetical protein [Croceivirga sp. JEA036]
MFHEQPKKMNMEIDFTQFMKFIDNLELDIEARCIKPPKANKIAVYTLNGEKVSVYFKNEVRPHNVPVFLNQQAEHPFLIASKYITPKAKKGLKENKINYLDSYGNAYIELPQLKIYTEHGNGKPVTPDTTKVFTQAGAQLIFHLLKRPEEVNETVRRLADISKISLGSVSKIINGLEDEGYLVPHGAQKKYQLINKQELLDRWIPVVNEKILPKQIIGRYSFTKGLKENWKTQFLIPNVLWAGEPAAHLLTDYLYPEKFTLFTTLNKQEILKTLKIVPDSNGQLTVYKPFWEYGQVITMDGKNTVDPLLIYAQLTYSGDPRNIETAQIIYNEHIAAKL